MGVGDAFFQKTNHDSIKETTQEEENSSVRKERGDGFETVTSFGNEKHQITSRDLESSNNYTETHEYSEDTVVVIDSTPCEEKVTNSDVISTTKEQSLFPVVDTKYTDVVESTPINTEKAPAEVAVVKKNTDGGSPITTTTSDNTAKSYSGDRKAIEEQSTQDEEVAIKIPEGYEDAIDVEFRDVKDIDDPDTMEILQNAVSHTEQVAQEATSGFKQFINKQVDKFANYIPTSDETIIDRIADDPLGFAATSVQSLAFTFSNAIAMHNLRKLMTTGTLVKSGDFEFIRSGNALILKSYSGVNNTVKIPTKVGKLPVTHIYPDFLYNGSNPFDNYKMRSFKNMWKEAGSGSLDVNEENTFFSDITDVILPDTLQAILPGTFAGCYGIRRLIVPASVKSMGNKAVSKSSINEIFFCGKVPNDFKINKFKGLVYQRVQLKKGE